MLIALLVVLGVDHLVAGQAAAEDVKRLGDRPVGIRFASGDAEIEVAARAESRELAAGPLTLPPLGGSRLHGAQRED